MEETSNQVIDRQLGDFAYLLGTPPLEEFVGFLRKSAAEGTTQLARRVDEWRGAARHLRELEGCEAGFADNAEIGLLSDRVKDAAAAELDDPGVQRSLERLPHYWGLVDLDQVVVYQRCLDRSFVERLARELPECPTDEQLFQLSAGNPKPDPAEIRTTRTSETLYTVAARSSDLRVLETTVLDPGTIQGYHFPGRVARVFALAVGYGVNFASVFRLQGRLILHNGTHRAATVYGRGIRKFPCLVREVSTGEDLDLVGAPEIKQHLSLYLGSPRPPRLSDFFDPRLHANFKVASAARLLHIQINAQQSRVPIL